MKTNGLAAAFALSLLSTTAAFAADLPSRVAPPVYAPPVPVFSWTGLYIGVQAGYEFGNDYQNFLGIPGESNNHGFAGGGHIGYLWSTQSLPLFNNAFGALFGSGAVIGLEGDVNGSTARTVYAIGPVTGTDRDSIQGSVRGRLGFAVDRILFYATGGAAFGGLTENYTSLVTGATDSINRTRVGYTAGGGIEYAISNNWSVRAEYRYTNFGGFTDTLAASAGGATYYHRETDNRVQLGISYKFDAGPSPVVARY